MKSESQKTQTKVLASKQKRYSLVHQVRSTERRGDETAAAASLNLNLPGYGRVTHILQGDDVGMLSVSQQDLHLLRRVSLGLVDDLYRGQTVFTVWER